MGQKVPGWKSPTEKKEWKHGRCRVLDGPTEPQTKPGLATVLNYTRYCTKYCGYFFKWASLLAQTVTYLPAMPETRVQSLGLEDPLEKEMATHSSILAWRIPWTEEPCRLQSMGSQRVRHDWATSLHFTSSFCQVRPRNAFLPNHFLVRHSDP